MSPSLPQQVASAAKKVKEWTAKRDTLIRQMHAEGCSFRDIAKASGMSIGGVQRVLNRDRIRRLIEGAADDLDPV